MAGGKGGASRPFPLFAVKGKGSTGGVYYCVLGFYSSEVLLDCILTASKNRMEEPIDLVETNVIAIPGVSGCLMLAVNLVVEYLDHCILPLS